MPKRRRPGENEHETLWEVVLACSRSSPVIDFGIQEFRQACLQRGRTLHVETGPDVHQIDADIRLELTSQPQLRAEGFRFQRSATALHAAAPDERGALYCLLELAERVRMGHRLEQIGAETHEPSLALRGFQCNLPLAPCLGGDPMRANLPTFWSLQFWRDFVDMLARHRFNVLVLRSMNPFAWMFPLQRWPGAHAGSDDQHEQRRQFWQGLFDHCLARGVEPYLLLWNIHLPHGVAAGLGVPEAWQGRTCSPQAMADRQAAELPKAYFAECLRTLLITYPQVRGLGAVAGPDMVGDDAQREQWLIDAYLPGIAQAERWPDFVRVVDSAQQARAVVDHFAPAYRGRVIVAPRHVHVPLLSDPQAVLGELRQVVRDVPDSLERLYTLSQDDVHCLRWADPQFVRDVVSAMPSPNVAGFQFGSDTYVWMQDLFSRQAEPLWRWDFQKHEEQFFLWGRVAYDKDLSDERFIALHSHRFGQELGRQTAAALQASSRIIPAVNRQLGRNANVLTHAETCLSPRGLRTIIDFMFARPAPGCRAVSIQDYAESELSGQSLPGETPPALAEFLHETATTTLAAVELLEPAARLDGGLWWLLRDLEAMACLGHYYGFKIAAAVELSLYRLSSRRAGTSRRTRASQLLAAAAGWWSKLSANTRDRYKTIKMPLLALPFGWWLYQQDVERDLLLAEQFDPDYDRPASAAAVSQPRASVGAPDCEFGRDRP